MAGDLRATERSGSLAPSPWSWKVAESMYKYLRTHIEVLKLCITVLVRVLTINNNYEQPIALFVILLAKNTFTMVLFNVIAVAPINNHGQQAGRQPTG